MSHPLNDTTPAARCADCTHFAPVGEITACRFCDCQRHTGKPYEPATPASAEQKLDAYVQALDDAEEAVTFARNAELEAENARDVARAAALLSEECPKTGTFGGVRITVAERDAWVAREIEPLEFKFRAAREVRRAAVLRFDKVRKQGSFAQSINGNARETLRTYGGRP